MQDFVMEHLLAFITIASALVGVIFYLIKAEVGKTKTIAENNTNSIDEIKELLKDFNQTLSKVSHDVKGVKTNFAWLKEFIVRPNN